ncbi:MAG: hypothetical protein BGO43_15955 [Gammaproteobacteria bacterium 39-13]|nr:universal stress protein [Gammaproteobacteria bacterium]OJV87898.1 MAG: hypothetical protein BGO43_15955 [Gammaproteobacteria bacterium 39-13]
MFKRILVPVDGSRVGNFALSKAIDLSKDQKCKLRIVHSIDYIALTAGVEGIDAVSLQKSLKKAAEKILEKAKKTAQKKKVKVEVKLIESFKLTNRIDNMILKDAKRWRADLIIVGTHKKRGLKQILFGSQAENLMHKATIPILLIRSKR